MPDDMRIDAPAPQSAKKGHAPRIAILGAGFSGMGMAIRLREEGFSNFTIYEKADEVGGTWRGESLSRRRLRRAFASLFVFV